MVMYRWDGLLIDIEDMVWCKLVPYHQILQQHEKPPHRLLIEAMCPRQAGALPLITMWKPHFCWKCSTPTIYKQAYIHKHTKLPAVHQMRKVPLLLLHLCPLLNTLLRPSFPLSRPLTIKAGTADLKIELPAPLTFPICWPPHQTFPCCLEGTTACHQCWSVPSMRSLWLHVHVRHFHILRYDQFNYY